MYKVILGEAGEMYISIYGGGGADKMCINIYRRAGITCISIYIGR